jgi:hypothetical protein
LVAVDPNVVKVLVFAVPVASTVAVPVGTHLAARATPPSVRTTSEMQYVVCVVEHAGKSARGNLAPSTAAPTGPEFPPGGEMTASKVTAMASLNLGILFFITFSTAPPAVRDRLPVSRE